MSTQDADPGPEGVPAEATAADQGADGAQVDDFPGCDGDNGTGAQQRGGDGPAVSTRTNPPSVAGPACAAPADASQALAVLDRLEAEATGPAGIAAVGREEASLLRATLQALSKRTASPAGDAHRGRTQKEMVQKFESLPDLYDEKELTGYLMAEYAHDEEGDAALHSVDRIAAAVGDASKAQRRSSLDNTRSAPLPAESVTAASPEAQDELRMLLRRVDDWDFDIFRVHELQPSGGTLCLLGHLVFRAHGVDDLFSIPKESLHRFLRNIQSAYKENPYHNAVHAADVLQTMHHVMVHSSFTKLLPGEELLAALVGPVVHDVGHPGVNNQFLVSTGHELALRYNDRSPLENMHVALASHVMQQDGCRILDGMPQRARSRFRKVLISTVLASDNAVHGKYLQRLQDGVAGGGLALEEEEPRLILLQNLLHAVDVSNPAKPARTARRWANALVEEFYVQGDEERRRDMPVTPMMDRSKPIPMEKFQAGFINAIVLPLFKSLASVDGVNVSCAMPHLHRNFAQWQRLIARRRSTVLHADRHRAAMQAASQHAAEAERVEAEHGEAGPLERRIRGPADAAPADFTPRGDGGNSEGGDDNDDGEDTSRGGSGEVGTKVAALGAAEGPLDAMEQEVQRSLAADQTSSTLSASSVLEHRSALPTAGAAAMHGLAPVMEGNEGERGAQEDTRPASAASRASSSRSRPDSGSIARRAGASVIRS